MNFKNPTIANNSLFRNLILALLLSSLFLLFVIRKESFETFQLLDFYSATLFLGQLIVIFFILYWPGRAIAEIILRKLTPELKNAVSFGISIFILAILALMIIKFDQIKFIPYLLSALVILSIFFLAIKRTLFQCFGPKWLWGMFGLIVIFTVVYQFTVSSFYRFWGFEGGYLIPYGLARIFHLKMDILSQQAIELLWWHQADDRTPLLALAQLNLIKFFDNMNPLIYVRLALIVPLLFFFPLYWWFKNIFSKNWIRILFVMIIFNPYIIYFNIEQPNRFFGFYFLLLFYLFLLKPPKEIRLWQSSILAGLFGGLAFLTHLYTTAFILAGFLYKLWQKPTRILWGNLIISAALTASLALPWFLWVRTLHPDQGSMFIRQLSKFNPVNYIQSSFWQEKWHTFSAMFVYYDQGRYQWEKFFTNFASYRYNFIQATTFSLFLLSLLAIIKLCRKYKKEFFFLFLIPILILIFGLSHGFPLRFFEGVSHIQPTILYLVVASAWSLSRIKSQIIQYMFLGLYVIEHLVAIWFLQWDIFARFTPIDYIWHFSNLESFWITMPLIIIYAFLIVILFSRVKQNLRSSYDH